MGHSSSDRISAELAREICLRTSSKALLAGSISSIGSHYALQLKASNCQTGETLATAAEEAESREKVLQALGRAATSVRSKLGESIVSVKKYDKRLEEVTTSSLQALQAFTEANSINAQRGPAAAVPFYRRAVELDADFAMAYASLGAIYTDLGAPSLAVENLRRAYELRDHVTELEKYLIAGRYYQQVTGELPKATEQINLAAQEYPRSLAHNMLGRLYDSVGQLDKAAKEYREEMLCRPQHYVGYFNLGATDVRLNRFDEAQPLLDEAFSRKLDAPLLHTLKYRLAFLKNDTASMRQELNWAMGKPRVESAALFEESVTQAYYGRLGKARATSRAAEAAALRDGNKESAAHMQALGALRDAELGSAVQARQKAHAALVLAQDEITRRYAATALALAGESHAARQLLDLVKKERPFDTLLQNYWLPAIQAQSEVNDRHAHRALQLLEAARPYDLTSLAPQMHAVHIRGQAYLAAGNSTAAVAEFQSILDHRGLVGNNVIGALARLYLGRAHALAARSLQGAAAKEAKTKARAAYQDFLTLWKDADTDIPILQQAKAEYAQLK